MENDIEPKLSPIKKIAIAYTVKQHLFGAFQVQFRFQRLPNSNKFLNRFLKRFLEPNFVNL